MYINMYRNGYKERQKKKSIKYNNKRTWKFVVECRSISNKQQYEKKM